MEVGAELDHLYEVATGGNFFTQDLSTDVKTRAETLERKQLSPPTVDQAEHYIRTVGLDPDKEKQLLNSYGILRERRFSVPPGQEKNAWLVYGLGDQRQFALALLLCAKRTEFDQFIRQFPNIF